MTHFMLGDLSNCFCIKFIVLNILVYGYLYLSNKTISVKCCHSLSCYIIFFIFTIIIVLKFNGYIRILFVWYFF